MNRRTDQVNAGRGQPRRAPRGFTLIELLVVIAIIAILALLLIPGMSSVMERYREVTCQTNLRQLSVAAFNYSTDLGILPDAWAWVPADYRWDVWSATNGTLYAYVKDPKPFLCPTFYFMVKDLPVSTMGGPTTGRNYSMNNLEWTHNIWSPANMRAPATKLFFSEENTYCPTYVDGAPMSWFSLNDGALCGSTDTDCTATFHRFNSCMASYFDGHTSRFIMDSGKLWKSHFTGN